MAKESVNNYMEALSELKQIKKQFEQRLAKHKSESDYMKEPRCSLRARNPVPTYCDAVDIGLPPLRKGSKLSSSWARRIRLSGGWGVFALDQKLDDGDALVFELVEHLRVGSTSSKTRALPSSNL
ncbi:hypothetical protein RHMOL_Rhmol05G0186500 [Rhododendron molle]|uniref:Uncharacterized protein n=1 Tax=Rhododendron molle TaxID=49168 RepID=A0ACC0NRX5_RHOML|nr:hypothetical protein RHMOL_Rhmol05G0186500 [Rhododendron molle]